MSTRMKLWVFRIVPLEMLVMMRTQMRGIHARCASCGEFEIRLGTLLGEAGNYLQAIEHFQLAMTVEPSRAPEELRAQSKEYEV